MIVAIDGPAASGKSTVGLRVARGLGLPFVDSGAMYRAVGCLALERDIDLDDEDRLTELAGSMRVTVDGDRVLIDGEDYTGRLHAPELSAAASRVAQFAGVRLAAVAQQRALGRGGVVMAGRDIGSVVFPDADFKFYLTGSAEERARRRASQIEARGERSDPERLRMEIEERDQRDAERAVAPMRPAEDAAIVQTDGLDLDGVVAEILGQIRVQIGRGA